MKIVNFWHQEQASKVSRNVGSVCGQEDYTECTPHIDKNLDQRKAMVRALGEYTSQSFTLFGHDLGALNATK